MTTKPDNKGCPGCQPRDLGDGWLVSTPAAEDMSTESLEGLADHFKRWSQANVHAVLMARNGKLVFEHYFTGKDEAWGKPLGKVTYDADKHHDLRSITKSVVALAFGIARERGGLDDLDQPVFDFFPEHADLATGEKKDITLRHLLEMSTGLEWNEDVPYSDPANSEICMTHAQDRCRYDLEQPLVRSPGRAWIYNGGTTALIAEIIFRTTGLQVDALAREALFVPLGITESDWLTYDNGVPIAASGLRLKPRDLLKLGQLVLDRGKAGDRQIVPSDWIDAMTTPQINGMMQFFYGYQWWLGRSLINRQEVTWSAGVGWGGQRLFVVPSQNLVVVVHAGLYDKPDMQMMPGEVVLRRYALTAAMA